MDGTYSKTKEELDNTSIKIIPYCRSYLQVHWLSNIGIAYGDHILESLFQGEISRGQSTLSLEEIVQERPYNKHRNVWRKLLCLLCYYNTNKSIQSLEDWTTVIQTSQGLWPFLLFEWNQYDIPWIPWRLTWPWRLPIW